MNILIIDEYFVFAKRLQYIFDNQKVEIINSFTKSLDNFAEEISGKLIIDQEAVIFINVNNTFSYFNIYEQKGIELLKLLRLNYVRNHCILYSFSSLNNLLRITPTNVIICAKGNTFIQLPFDFSRIKIEELQHEQADLEKINLYFKGSYDINSFRHSFSNVWGVHRLWEIHKIVDSNFSSRKLNGIIEYQKVGEKLKDLVGLQLKSIFCYSDNEIRTSLINNQIESTRKDIDDAQRKLVLFKNLLLCSKNNEDRRTYENNISINKQEKEKKEDLLLELENEKKYRNDSKIDFKKFKIQYYKDKIVHNKPKILYIDDMADEGWLNIFKLMTYRDINSKNIESAPPIVNETIENYYTTKIRSIVTNYNLILLDIRLLDERDTSISISELSGIKLLKLIRNDNEGIPIIIVTASNKALTLQECILYKADGYWTKEGIDERKNTEDSVKNYEDFLKLICGLSNDEYKYFNGVCIKRNRISNNKFYWWNNKVWGNNDITQIDVKEITYILDTSIFLFRNYLRNRHLHKSSKDVENLELSVIIQHLGKIIEAVHNYDKKDLDFSPTINARKYKAGATFKIIDLRNKASHYHQSQKLTFDDLKNMFDYIFDYLSN